MERPAADRASAYGLEPLVVDGNDVEAVYAMARRTIDRARAGDGPSLVEAITYRHGGHSRADPGTYRPPEEVEAWLARDPIPAHRQRLLEAGVEAAALDAIDAEVAGRGGRGRGGGALRARAGSGDGHDAALGGRRLRMAEMTYRSRRGVRDRAGDGARLRRS